MVSFVDRVVLNATAGAGGHGCASIHREKFKPLGGPDGGNGGHGAAIILQVDPQITTLLDYHHAPHQKADNGGPGMGDHRNGANGKDLVLPVPPGTVIKDQQGNVLADLIGLEDSYTVAEGGLGGLGNAALASKKRKAPGFALLGEPGEEATVVLELKSIADVALIGYPSAGKSSLIAAISAARPKIADYPFTTLIPNLGVVKAGEMRYTVADVPGLIPGASEGKGLGLEFLRHVERCAVLVHVIDCATLESDRDPLHDLKVIEQELANYVGDSQLEGGYIPLAKRPRLVVLNKADIPEAQELAEFVKPDLEKLGLKVFIVSAVQHLGLRDFSYQLGELVEKLRKYAPPLPPKRITITPRAVDEKGFTVRKIENHEGKYFVIGGKKPYRWVKQTDFQNNEAIGYLADRRAKLGVEEALLKNGALAGDEVRIGPDHDQVVFDWQPTISTGAELLGGPRGSDVRLEDLHRPTRADKRQTYHDLMDAKAKAREELWTERESGVWTDPGEAETTYEE